MKRSCGNIQTWMRAARAAVFVLCACAAVYASGCSKRSGESTPALESDTATGGLAAEQLPAQHLDRIVERFNRGVALMEQYRPGDAAEAFGDVVDLAPDWTRGRLNLGLALMNVQSPESRARAEDELRRVVSEAPDDPYGHFALGILLRHLTRVDEARAQFQAVLRVRPDDPDAHYQLAILSMQTQPEAARAHLETTLKQVPHHESACYQLQALLRQQGELERADELLARFQALKLSGAGVVSRMRYGEMGRYAEVIRALDDPTVEAFHAPPRFSAAAQRFGLDFTARGVPGWPGDVSGTTNVPGAEHFGPGVAAADVDGDGDLDVFVPGGASEHPGALFENEAGAFVRVSDAGIDARNAIGAFFADYDADGDPDLYLTCNGANRLYRNEGGSSFTDVTQQTGTAGDDVLSVGAAWADADHDGDVDLYVANYGATGAAGDGVGAPNVLWRNNGDDTFTDVARDAGIDGGQVRTVGVLFVDVDDDRDLDLYLVHDRAENQVFLNDRIGRYTDATAWFAELADRGPGTGAVLADLDQDGREDILLIRGPATPRLFLQAARGRFVEDTRFAGLVRTIGGAVGAVAGDFDLDGDWDLVLTGCGSAARSTHRLLINRGGARFEDAATLGEPSPQPNARGALTADFDGDGGLEVVIVPARGHISLWHATPDPTRHWLHVATSKATDSDGAWMEARALGALVEVKTGTRMQLARVSTSSGYLGGTAPVLHFGLGTATEADYARISWPDAVLQSEIEIAADRVWRVQKVERKPSSCPLLFVWNGTRFEYVTDFLGVGGVGFFVAPGVYAPPDPTEDVRIAPGTMFARDGRYRMRIAEPLEEVTYLDEVHLVAYDHPSAWEVYPDERFTASAPLPTGEPRAVVEKIFPVAASNRRGEDVLEQILEIDRRYVEPPKLARFVGYAEDHWLELEFDAALRDRTQEEALVLCLYGWVEYTYSHVNYAAHQAGLRMRPPAVEVPDGNGGWRVLVEEMGFPAGLPRMMTYDLSSAQLAGHERFRIRSNMEIFWDQIFIGRCADARRLRVQRLQPVVARLRHLGYPQEYSPDGSLPTVYDYHRLDPGIAFKNMRGSFTANGDVRQLLAEVDDRFVIMPRGSEIALEFDATKLPVLDRGWSRTWALHSDGYCKDMDLYTAFPESVEPLPYHGMQNYPPEGTRSAEAFDAASRP